MNLSFTTRALVLSHAHAHAPTILQMEITNVKEGQSHVRLGRDPRVVHTWLLTATWRSALVFTQLQGKCTNHTKCSKSQYTEIVK